MDTTPMEIDFTLNEHPHVLVAMSATPGARMKCLACKHEAFVLLPCLRQHCEAHVERGEGYTNRDEASREWGAGVHALVIVRSGDDLRYFNFSGLGLFRPMQ